MKEIRQEQITQSICEIIAVDPFSFFFVENKRFRKLMNLMEPNSNETNSVSKDN